MHKIKIENLKQKFKIGWTSDERTKPQTLAFDIELEFPFDRSIESDSLKDTIDYMEVIGTVERMGTEGEWRLVEKLSKDLAVELLAQFKILQCVTIHLRKKISESCDFVQCSVKVGRDH